MYQRLFAYPPVQPCLRRLLTEFGGSSVSARRTVTTITCLSDCLTDQTSGHFCLPAVKKPRACLCQTKWRHFYGGHPFCVSASAIRAVSCRTGRPIWEWISRQRVPSPSALAAAAGALITAGEPTADATGRLHRQLVRRPEHNSSDAV